MAGSTEHEICVANMRTQEALLSLADQVGAMRSFEDQDAPDRPHMSKVCRAYLSGAGNTLRAVVADDTEVVGKDAV